MDGLTSAVAVLTIVQMAIKVGGETYKVFQEARKAPVHIQSLATELRDLYTLLETLQQLLQKNHSQDDRIIADMLENVETILRNCMTVFH